MRILFTDVICHIFTMKKVDIFNIGFLINIAQTNGDMHEIDFAKWIKDCFLVREGH
jgi:hypothetical protein